MGTYTNSTTYFSFTDWLGTERVRAGVNGATVETCEGAPYGDMQSCTGTDQSPLHFTGDERDPLIRGAGFLGVVALCVLASPQRYLILAGVLAIIFTRGIVGLALYHSVASLIVGLAAGIACYFLTARKGISLSPDYKVNDYSYSELAVDVVILGAVLLLYSKLS